MDKELQVAILKECAKAYPKDVLLVWDNVLDITPGDSVEEKMVTLVPHLAALEEFGYIEGFFHGHTDDGIIKYNRAFRVTGQVLLAAGEDLLHPDPHAGLREALFAQAQALRSLSQEDERTLKSVLVSLPKVALERLRDKGLDLLLDLVCG